MVTRKCDRPQSRKLSNTHMRLTPFLDENNSRFLVYCSCARHPGFLRTMKRLEDHPYCKPIECVHHKKLSIENSHEYDIDLINANLKNQEKGIHPTYRFHPQRDDQGKPFFWVLDRGNFVYLLHPSKQSLFEQLDRDHFQLYF